MWLLYELATSLHNTLLEPEATARTAVAEADKLWKDNMLFLGMFESNLLKDLGEMGHSCLVVYTADKVWPRSCLRACMRLYPTDKVLRISCLLHACSVLTGCYQARH